MSDLPKKLYHGAGHQLDCVAPTYASELRYIALLKGSEDAIRHKYGDRFNFATGTISEFHMTLLEPLENVSLDDIARLNVYLSEIPVGHEPGVVWEKVVKANPEYKCWMTHSRLSIFSDKRTLRFCDIHRGKRLTLVLPDGNTKTKVL